MTTSRDQIGRVDDTSSLRRLRVLVVEDDPDSRDLIVALLVRSVAAGNQGALLALYERAHRVVFTLIMRITVNHATAEEVTLDVFHDVWRRASCYHEADGTVLGWIMNQARSRAVDRLRFEQRKKRVPSETTEHLPATATATPEDLVAFQRQAPGGSSRAGGPHARRAPGNRGGVLFRIDLCHRRRAVESAARHDQDANPLRIA